MRTTDTKDVYKKSTAVFLMLGLLGCVLMASADYLMIYGDTSFVGKLPWLTVGVGQVSPFRNGLAMALAFPAVILYVLGMLVINRLYKTEKSKRNYTVLTVIGFTPWLCIHLLYLVIFYVFGYLTNAGKTALAHSLCEAVFNQFSFVLSVGQLFMILPFLYVLSQVLGGKTVLPKALAFHNPLFYYVLLKTVSGFFADSPARLAFVNGLMSESMLVWFLGYLAVMIAHKKKKARAN